MSKLKIEFDDIGASLTTLRKITVSSVTKDTQVSLTLEEEPKHALFFLSKQENLSFMKYATAVYDIANKNWVMGTHDGSWSGTETHNITINELKGTSLKFTYTAGAGVSPIDIFYV